MRSRFGQLSDSKPLQRTLDEKRRQLREIEDHVASLRPSCDPSTRRVAEAKRDALRQEILSEEVRVAVRAQMRADRSPGQPRSGGDTCEAERAERIRRRRAAAPAEVSAFVVRG